MSDQPVSNSFPQKQAAVAIIREGETFLAIKRSATVRAPGMICFPGGGVEPGESIAEALVREMQEELSIQVIPGNQVWKSHSVRGYELNWWHASIGKGESIRVEPKEVESFQWMTAVEMLALPNLLDSNLEFFQALHRGEFVL